MGSQVHLFLRLHFFAVDVTCDAAKKMHGQLSTRSTIVRDMSKSCHVPLLQEQT